jgi:hypothetical protein
VAILSLIAETDPITFTDAAAGGDEFDNAAGTSGLQIFNNSGGELRVAFVEQRKCNFDGQDVHAGRIVTVAAGATMRIPRFQMWRYNNSNKRVEMIYPDGEAGLKLAALDRPCL